MLRHLKNHPFAVAAHFDYSLVLTFAVPKAQLEPLLPPCLQLDTHNNEWGFVALAMVQTRELRPKGFPRWMGNDFFLIGYRIFVQYTTQSGKRLRGLYIIRSETNKKKMTLLGNIFTHYNYTHTDISSTAQNGILSISSRQSGLQVQLNIDNEAAALPIGSPLPDWKTARRFAGPLPFTFTFDEKRKEVLIIEGVRENWLPQPVEVLTYHSDFIDQLGLQGICLANAFIIRDIPYYWKKGKKEQWNP